MYSDVAIPAINGEDILFNQISLEPFVQTEASMAVVVDEYDPMRPNDYEECKQKQREKEQRERELERSQRDKDYDDRLACLK